MMFLFTVFVLDGWYYLANPKKKKRNILKTLGFKLIYFFFFSDGIAEI